MWIPIEMTEKKKKNLTSTLLVLLTAQIIVPNKRNGVCIVPECIRAFEEEEKIK